MRKELLAKRRKLSQEIEDLNKMRIYKKGYDEINDLINKKKKEYNYYNTLLKTIGGNNEQ